MPTNLVITMTRDELIARIDDSDATNNGTGWKLLPIPAALRAVVELHKPVENSYYAIKKLDACEHCVTSYPCTTIEQITEILN